MQTDLTYEARCRASQIARGDVTQPTLDEAIGSCRELVTLIDLIDRVGFEGLYFTVTDQEMLARARDIIARYRSGGK